jgi:serine/threonine protein kinase
MTRAPKAGDQLGRWQLRESLGCGGNAEVWHALDGSTGEIAAVKVLKARNQDSDSFRRFQRELEINEKIAGDPGVIPVIDSYIPRRGEHGSRAWLAMPLAVPIVRALRHNHSLPRIVTAVLVFARTLVRLKAISIAHRDLKPSNLYHLNGRPAIGDFGLVKAVDAPALTIAGKAIGGPRHFMHDELLRKPAGADPFAGDVFALAKTFWCLAMAEEIPPQGHQRLDSSELISRRTGRAADRPLDALIERATAGRLGDLPTMEEFSQELEAWLKPPEALGSSDDISDLGSRLDLAIAPSRHHQRFVTSISEDLIPLLDRVRTLLKPTEERLRRLTSFSVQETAAGRHFELSPQSTNVESLGHGLIVQVGPVTLLVGVGLQIDIRRRVAVTAACLLHDPAEAIWSATDTFHLGSPAEAHVLSGVVSQLDRQLRPAFEHLLRRLQQETATTSRPAPDAASKGGGPAAARNT